MEDAGGGATGEVDERGLDSLCEDGPVEDSGGETTGDVDAVLQGYVVS